jgi:chaperone modulatory protein CbpM
MVQEGMPMPDVRVEIIEDAVLRLEDVARLCCVSTEWVLARIEGEALHAQWRDGGWCFTSQELWRARQIAAVEAQFDADPQLAALVADLLQEVRALRSRLTLHDE